MNIKQSGIKNIVAMGMAVDVSTAPENHLFRLI